MKTPFACRPLSVTFLATLTPRFNWGPHYISLGLSQLPSKLAFLLLSLSIPNTATQIILQSSTLDHVTFCSEGSYWLFITYRIKSKFLTFTKDISKMPLSSFSFLSDIQTPNSSQCNFTLPVIKQLRDDIK